MAVFLKPKLLFVVTEDWYFLSHRLPIARAARRAGYEVWVATRINKEEDAERIRAEGLHLAPINMQRSSLRLDHQVQAVVELVRLYRHLRPDIVHHVAMQPVVYGTLAAQLARVPAVVNAMAGLGFIFASASLRARFLRVAVRMAFRFVLRRRNSRFILQNPDDLRLFVEQRLVAADRLTMIRGSGVDIDHFQPLPEPNGKPAVALVARMLRDKGAGVLVEAARLLRERGQDVRVILAGGLDRLNPNCLDEQEIRAWEKESLVEWWGEVADVRQVWKQAHVAALPTFYGEGLPKSLLEAAACCRPLLATDWPGCREIVRHGENGLLVPVHDSKALAEALQNLLDDSARRFRMGTRGREIVVDEFTEERVIAETLALYGELLHATKFSLNQSAVLPSFRS
jgi:glycosyltransferase involved in cell wall biosynthesis